MVEISDPKAKATLEKKKPSLCWSFSKGHKYDIVSLTWHLGFFQVVSHALLFNLGHIEEKQDLYSRFQGTLYPWRSGSILRFPQWVFKTAELIEMSTTNSLRILGLVGGSHLVNYEHS